MGKQGVDVVGRVSADTVEDVAEVGDGIDLVAFATDSQAGEDCGGLASLVASGEQPVLAADNEVLDCLFGGIVVDRQSAVLSVANQCVPVR